MLVDDEDFLGPTEENCSSELLPSECDSSFDFHFFDGVVEGDVLSKIDVISPPSLISWSS